MPTATAELKTQTSGQDVSNAMRQYRTDRNPADLIFRARTLVHFAVDQDTVYMTTGLAGVKTVFLPFNQGSEGPGVDGGSGNPLNPGGHRTAYLWEQVWAPDSWLDLLGSFVHVGHVLDRAGRKTGETFTVFPRYHQWDAVTRLLGQARKDGPGHNKLIQHSAGSGKSNTIAWLAHRLSRLHTHADPALVGEGATAAGLGANEPVFDKVVIVTDRLVLDRQLQDTVASFDHTPGMIVKIDQSSAQLKAALEGKQARIVITTLQKFPVIAQSATDLAGMRFAVVVDEAHTSQTGEAVKDLKAVLGGLTGADALRAAASAESPAMDSEDLLVDSVTARGRQENLTFFAFTATPKHRTLSLFGETVTDPSGEPRHVPFHMYSMRQAIEEGFISTCCAATRPTRRTTGSPTGSRPATTRSCSRAGRPRRWRSGCPCTPRTSASGRPSSSSTSRHHTAAKIGGRAKAMVVTPSRLHAVRYYQAITAYIAEKGYDVGTGAVRALVAFSGTLTDPDAPEVDYRESLVNGFPESQLPERFAGEEFQVLVVAEKYQTGFDQPLLHTMYVVKRLASVNAVQTLSRLNRTTPLKEDTFVLDFVNSGEEIQEAFAPFFSQTTAAPSDPNILYNLQRRIEDHHVIDATEQQAAVQAVLRGGAAGSAALNSLTDTAVQRWHGLEEDVREDFRTALRDFVRAYAFLAQIVPFRDTGLEELYYYGK